MTTWQYVGAFLVLGWTFLGICIGLDLGGVKSIAVDVFEVLGAASVLTAGAHLARGTWAYRFIGWIVHIHPIAGYVAFLAILVGIVLFVVAVLPARVYSATSVTMSIAVFGVFLPSLLVQVNLPGTWGGAISDACAVPIGFLVQVTGGAWG